MNETELIESLSKDVERYCAAAEDTLRWTKPIGTNWKSRLLKSFLFSCFAVILPEQSIPKRMPA